jgi:hypothetical protein
MKRILALISILLTVYVVSGKDTKQEIAAMKHVHFFGGPGDARETAVIIEGAKSAQSGMEAEYYFIGRKYGQKDKKWTLVAQSLDRDTSRVFDVLEIEDKSNGNHYFLYFDITQCSWASKKK